MSAKYLIAAGLLVAAGLGLGMPRPTVAADDDKPPTKEAMEKAEKNAKFVEDLAAAYRLAEFGEEHKLPEVMLAAGAALLKLHALAGLLEERKDQPLDKDGKPLKSEPVAQSLKDDAAKLFQKVSDEAVSDSKLGPKLTALLEQVKARDYGPRGAAGGPKTVTRKIAAGETHTYNIDYITGVPASFGIRSTTPIRCKMAYKKYVHFEQVVKTGNYGWVPKPDKDDKFYRITIKNEGPAGEYTFFTN